MIWRPVETEENKMSLDRRGFCMTSLGLLGHSSVARARPDGYTLLLGVNSTYAMARHLFPQRGYDDEKAFASAGRLAISPIFLCANPKLGANDIKTLVEKAKAQPGKLSYGSSGAGSSAHLEIGRASCR